MNNIRLEWPKKTAESVTIAVYQPIFKPGISSWKRHDSRVPADIQARYLQLKASR
jgi:hypothetical protein